jgi:hypothetical protein
MPFLHLEAHNIARIYYFTNFAWILLKFCGLEICDAMMLNNKIYTCKLWC